MGITLSLTGKTNVDLTHQEVLGYGFEYKVTDAKYAKGHYDYRALELKLSISQILTNNPSALDELREWVSTRFADDPETYHHKVKLVHTHREETIREIIFPDAFVKACTEDIDPFTGQGTMTITLHQKYDKRIAISIEPFNVAHPSLSDIMNPDSKLNKLANKSGNITPTSSRTARFIGDQNEIIGLSDTGYAAGNIIYESRAAGLIHGNFDTDTLMDLWNNSVGIQHGNCPLNSNLSAEEAF